MENKKTQGYTNQSKPPWETQTIGMTPEFENTKAKVTPEEPKPNSSVRKFVYGEAQVESKKTQRPGHMVHITRKHRKTFSKPGR